VMLAVAADGRNLLYLIYKRKTTAKVKLPNCVQVRVQGKHWMAASVICDCVRTVWGQWPGTLLWWPSLLVWDSVCGHLVEETKRILTEMKTYLAVIPGGLTSVLQPLDLLFFLILYITSYH
jgi:hypothetical protein